LAEPEPLQTGDRRAHRDRAPSSSSLVRSVPRQRGAKGSESPIPAATRRSDSSEIEPKSPFSSRDTSGWLTPAALATSACRRRRRIRTARSTEPTRTSSMPKAWAGGICRGLSRPGWVGEEGGTQRNTARHREPVAVNRVRSRFHVALPYPDGRLSRRGRSPGRRRRLSGRDAGPRPRRRRPPRLLRPSPHAWLRRPEPGPGRGSSSERGAPTRRA
jgi:hypothetical protein